MDLIDRQDVINAICTWDKFGVDGRGRVVRWYEGLEPYVHLRDVVFAIEKLPSAEPEALIDKEQRIFLAAMEREEKVCKQVDEEWRDCREPYEDSLVHICHEIKRKVKGALWT